MPQTGMDIWAIIGVLVAIAGLGFAIWQWRKPKKPQTVNTIKGGSHNRQSGGAGETSNTIENGDHNDQRG